MSETRRNEAVKKPWLTTERRFVAKPLEERFWEKVERRGPDECWPWIGGKSKDGRGAFHIGPKIIVASRVAWSLATGNELVQGLHICHRCDNPVCCNPAHLWLGTASDNQRDAVKKGRHWTNRGRPRPDRKFTDDEIRDIRSSAANGEAVSAIARRYEASRSMIRRIIQRVTYQCIGDAAA